MSEAEKQIRQSLTYVLTDARSYPEGVQEHVWGSDMDGLIDKCVAVVIHTKLVKEPDEVGSAKYGSIAMASRPHKMCHERDWEWGRQVGEYHDVRRCVHGKLQIMEMDSRPGEDKLFWWDLRPVWDMKKYRQARKALGEI